MRSGAGSLQTSGVQRGRVGVRESGSGGERESGRVVGGGISAVQAGAISYRYVLISAAGRSRSKPGRWRSAEGRWRSKRGRWRGE